MKIVKLDRLLRYFERWFYFFTVDGVNFISTASVPPSSPDRSFSIHLNSFHSFKMLNNIIFEKWFCFFIVHIQTKIYFGKIRKRLCGGHARILKCVSKCEFVTKIQNVCLASDIDQVGKTRNRWYLIIFIIFVCNVSEYLDLHTSMPICIPHISVLNVKKGIILLSTRPSNY